jgi:hypothetical protein
VLVGGTAVAVGGGAVAVALGGAAFVGSAGAVVPIRAASAVALAMTICTGNFAARPVTEDAKRPMSGPTATTEARIRYVRAIRASNTIGGNSRPTSCDGSHFRGRGA